MKRQIYFIILLSTLYFLFSNAVSAATVKIYFGGPTALGVGSEFALDVLVDSDAPLNAYALQFRYPSDRLTLEGFDDSQSIIDVWQTRPTAYGSGTVTLQGGSTQAFSGSQGKIVTARFRVTAAGSADLSITSAAVYLADGRGTQATPLVGSFVIDLSLSLPPSNLIPVGKPAPPEIRSLAVVTDPENGASQLLSFEVRGVENGVSSTEVRYRTGFAWSVWHPVQNPVVLPYGAWSVDFRVADLAGNISEKTIYDWSNLLNYFGLPILAVVAALVLGFSAIHRLRKNKVV